MHSTLYVAYIHHFLYEAICYGDIRRCVDFKGIPCVNRNKRQVDQAKQFPWFALHFRHYWNNGKRMLDNKTP